MSDPFAPPLTAVSGGAVFPTSTPGASQIPLLPPPYIDSTSASSSSPDSATSASSSTSIIIVVIVIASAAIVSAAIYLLLRFVSRRFHRSFDNDVVSRHDSASNLNRPMQHQVAPSGLLDSLPLFTFRSVTGSLAGGDCAVCLSKFEADDQLRLLPLCCHAFHAPCIDAWIVSNQTCPLCRSAVVSSDADLLNKIDSSENRGISNHSFRSGSRSGGSFRIEIGSISRRHGGAMEALEGERRAYSIGSFDYIVDENGYEIPVGSVTHRSGISDCNSADKESSIGIPFPEPPGEVLAADVAGGRNWLREYVDRLASVSISSRAMSFRSSGRFFSGSSRRSEHAAAAAAPPEDLEASRAGEEISELFRWLSGV